MSHQSRRARIELFFHHWPEFETNKSPLVTSATALTDTTGVALMPPAFRDPAVGEFYRCLLIHRERAPVQHGHLAAFYKSEWRVNPRGLRVVRSAKGGKRLVEYRPQRERVVPRWVRLEKVRKGVTFVVLIWSRDVDPSFPDHLLVRDPLAA